jgi:hypothetical protein
MGFRISARTLFHLGSDLISSDAIALYELVKNAFDAGSKEVEIKCTVRIPGEGYLNLQRELRSDVRGVARKAEAQRVLEQWKPRVDAVVDVAAPSAAVWRAEMQGAASLAELLKTLEEANTLKTSTSLLARRIALSRRPHSSPRKERGTTGQSLGTRGSVVLRRCD